MHRACLSLAGLALAAAMARGPANG
jgi:hypothetical protein